MPAAWLGLEIVAERRGQGPTTDLATRFGYADFGSARGRNFRPVAFCGLCRASVFAGPWLNSHWMPGFSSW